MRTNDPARTPGMATDGDTRPANSVLVEAQLAGGERPTGLRDLLTGLADGENGFGGTAFGRGEQTLDEFLAHCVRGKTEPQPGFVPQTVFWIVDSGRAAGMLRMRHTLNDKLRVEGGHIGYYVAPGSRGKGLAGRALGEALMLLRGMGLSEVMLTTDPDNVASIRVIEGHGGRLTGQPEHDGAVINQYWIDL